MVEQCPTCNGIAEKNNEKNQEKLQEFNKYKSLERRSHGLEVDGEYELLPSDKRES